MKRIALTLALMAGFALGGVAATDAFAKQEDRPRGRSLSRPTETRDQSGEVVRDTGGKPMTPAQRKERGMAEAPGVVQRAGATCTVTDAIYNGAGKTAGPAGTPIDVQTYEVACQEGLGFLLEDRTTEVRAFDCIVAKFAADRAAAAAPAAPAAPAQPARRGQAAAAAPQTAKPPVCELPANANPMAGIQAVANRANARCTVTQVAYIGYVPTTKVTRYELACSEGMGIILDRPDAAATAPSSFTCLAAEAGGYNCTLTDKAARTAWIAGLARSTGKPCQVSDARLMGTARGADFYEVACAGAAGFVMEAKDGRVSRTIDCLEASQIGGGCTLSSTQAALEVREQQYLQTLRASGVVCQGEEFRLIGKDARNNRDVVEFRCANKPVGLVAFIPTAAGGQVTSFDCIEAEGRAIKCTMTDRPAIMRTLTTAMAEKNCTVINYAVLGASGGADGEVLEVACQGGGNGYVVDLPTSRGKPTKILSCQQSASRGGDRCRLPENAGQG